MTRPLPATTRRYCAALLDLVRAVRVEQLLDCAAGARTSEPTRALTEELDRWLADLGYPPAVPLEFDPAERELLDLATPVTHDAGDTD